MSAFSTTFSEALVRAPSDSSVDGLRARDTGPPDLRRFRRHHAAYVAALAQAGLRVHELPALEPFPDSVFVEDTALCLPDCALLLRPGAPSRRGEVDAIRAALEARYRDVLPLEGPGAVDGGDVLVTEREILVGLSARTDAAGAEALRARLAPRGYRVRTVAAPAEVLHLKSDCSLLDTDTVLATERLARSGVFGGLDVVLVADGEEAAANAVRVNDVVIFPAGFPRTAARLAAAGYRLHEVENSEAAKLDGGMSCLSLRLAIADGARAG